MSITFKAERPYLPDYRIIAENRLKMLGKRLDRDEDQKEKYIKGIHKLLVKGYAKVPPEDMKRADGKVCHIIQLRTSRCQTRPELCLTVLQSLKDFP